MQGTAEIIERCGRVNRYKITNASSDQKADADDVRPCLHHTEILLFEKKPDENTLAGQLWRKNTPGEDIESATHALHHDERDDVFIFIRHDCYIINMTQNSSCQFWCVGCGHDFKSIRYQMDKG